MLFLFSSPAAFAEVQARVRIIKATNEGTSVDPVLADVHGQLGTLFSFTSYRLVHEINVGLVGNRPVEVPVHSGRSVEVTLIGQYRNFVELRIRVKREGAMVLNTHVRLLSGRTILIGGPSRAESSIIFAISARF